MTDLIMLAATLLLAALASEALTEILVEAKITDCLRKAVSSRAFPDQPPGDVTKALRFWRFLHALTTCGYCMSVWTALLLAWVPPRLFPGSGYGMAVVEYVVKALIIHRLSNWLHVGFVLFQRGRVKTHDYKFTLEGGVNVTGLSEQQCARASCGASCETAAGVHFEAGDGQDGGGHQERPETIGP